MHAINISFISSKSIQSLLNVLQAEPSQCSTVTDVARRLLPRRVPRLAAPALTMRYLICRRFFKNVSVAAILARWLSAITRKSA